MARLGLPTELRYVLYFLVQIDKLVLEATYLGDASMAPKEYMTITSTTQVIAWAGRASWPVEHICFTQLRTQLRICMSCASSAGISSLVLLYSPPSCIPFFPGCLEAAAGEPQHPSRHPARAHRAGGHAAAQGHAGAHRLQVGSYKCVVSPYECGNFFSLLKGMLVLTGWGWVLMGFGHTAAGLLRLLQASLRNCWFAGLLSPFRFPAAADKRG